MSEWIEIRKENEMYVVTLVSLYMSEWIEISSTAFTTLNAWSHSI